MVPFVVAVAKGELDLEEVEEWVLTRLVANEPT